MRGGIMGLSSFLNVGGFDFPCPGTGFKYTIVTTVTSGRNANNQVVGQKVGRDLYKFNNLRWPALDPKTCQMMLKAVEPFYVPVTFEDS